MTWPMHLPTPDTGPDSPAQRQADRQRLLRALTASVAFVLLLLAAFAAQGLVDWRPWAVSPQVAEGVAKPRRKEASRTAGSRRISRGSGAAAGGAER